MALSFFKKFLLYLFPNVSDNTTNQIGYQTIQQEYLKLKEKTRNFQTKSEQLNSIKEHGEFLDYKNLKEDLISESKQILSLNKDLKEYIDDYVYFSIEKYLHNFITENSEEEKNDEILELRLRRIAPELLSIHHDLSDKTSKIYDKISVMSFRRAEFTALQEVRDKRALDIFSGYLKIKTSPEEYNNSNEKLSEGVRALNNLLEENSMFLKELNEDSLHSYNVTTTLVNSTPKGE